VMKSRRLIPLSCQSKGQTCYIVADHGQNGNVGCGSMVLKKGS
jgi:hypothetical protein